MKQFRWNASKNSLSLVNSNNVASSGKLPLQWLVILTEKVLIKSLAVILAFITALKNIDYNLVFTVTICWICLGFFVCTLPSSASILGGASQELQALPVVFFSFVLYSLVVFSALTKCIYLLYAGGPCIHGTTDTKDPLSKTLESEG